MSADTAPKEDPAAKPPLAIEQGLSLRSDPGDSAPPMPSSALEALKIAHLSGDMEGLAQAMDRIKAASPLPKAKKQTAVGSATKELAAADYAAELISEIRQAFTKIESLESGQRGLADALSALDERIRQLEAGRREAKAD